MSDPKPTRSQGDLAELLETLLDKGVVINADIAVTVGDTELLGIKLRAALASFETAAKYGLEFPSGTDMTRVRNEAELEQPPTSNMAADNDRAATDGGTRTAPESGTASEATAPSADSTTTNEPEPGRSDESADPDGENPDQ